MSDFSITAVARDPNYFYAVTRPNTHQLDGVDLNGDEVTLKYILVEPSSSTTDDVDSGIRVDSVTEDREITVDILLEGVHVQKINVLLVRTGG